MDGDGASVRYTRRINQKLTDESSAEVDDLGVLSGPCWPDDAALPRVVRRNGEVVLDEGWIRDAADEAPDDYDSPTRTTGQGA
jgi:hypothetical protein